ncbi:ADP-ribose pyrophosphatase YjhB (NUDIX family) [Cytobacillus eiseniae]|uniref:ADP-ribose pyrophosphatase YjhB (NUDIX family) n=1 Tax=Cytobacillus eiseniae TaxID=762947 RepID=A0ABS4RI89_9BACI|nr:NUDIX domain-containing protein [Cytobacillus eiseniae]MBP2241547.1 ADP-ribose pyrophosphatase YjhB (NUDIX family) [Cytobacillus eiseniae]
MAIRNSAKALIVQENKLLAIKKQDKEGYYFILPGGGQEHGENLHETLKRECIEEINADVEIGDLLFIREYIGKNHEHFAFDSAIHQTEYMFLCKVIEGSKEIGNGTVPDDGQIGVEWLPLSELLNFRVYPQSMREYLLDYIAGKQTPVYLGDVN